MRFRSGCGLLSAGFLLCISVAAVGEQSCDESRAQAQVAAARRAWAEFRQDEALNFLNNSISECASYEAYEQLGEYHATLGAQHGREHYKKAVDAFVEAEGLATDDRRRSLTIYHYAELLVEDGQPASAVPLLDRAHTLDSQNTAIASLQASVEKQSEHLTRAQTQRALEYPLYKPLKAQAPGGRSQARPATSSGEGTVELPFIPIHFQTNSTALDDSSRANLESLADALADPKHGHEKFLLIGHADQRGSDAHNVDLSLRRAQTISQWLIARQSSLDGRVMVEGHGAHEPLDMGTTEHAFWINRRLEVVLQR
jgi:outer membrane protein OmpA-like peptidoglycan-associated protein